MVLQNQYKSLQNTEYEYEIEYVFEVVFVFEIMYSLY